MMDGLDRSKLESKRRKVEDTSETILSYVDKIVSIYCKDLDALMLAVQKMLNDIDNPPTRTDLEHIVLHMPSLLFWASQGQEVVTLKSAVASLFKEESFSTAMGESGEAKVSAKKEEARQKILYDEVMEIVYDSAAKKIKAKINFGYEMLQSSKKILSTTDGTSWASGSHGTGTGEQNKGKRKDF